MENSKDFKILELSNAHWVPSGYGTQTRGHIFEWNKYYDVRELAIYGLQGAWRGETSPKDPNNMVVVYPTLWGDDHGAKTARLIFNSWNPDVFITLYDIFMEAYAPLDRSTGRYVPIHPYWIPVCVSGDTEILGSDNTVLGFDGSIQHVAVMSTQILKPTSLVYEIKTSENRRLKITADNPIWTKRGWILAKNLKETDMVSVYLGKSDGYGNNMGISGWISRWRRNYNHQSGSKNSERRTAITIPQNNNIKQLENVDDISKGSTKGKLQRNETTDKWQLQTEGTLLPDRCGRLQSSKRTIDENTVLSDSEGKTGIYRDAVHKLENRQIERIQPEERQEGYRIRSGNKETELTTWERVTGKQDITRTVKRVYDLTTYSHNFYANGILIHNCMVDHDPIPEKTLTQAQVAYKTVAVSRHGEKQLKDRGVDCEYIPFGLDTDVFKPSADKKKDKTFLNKHSVPINQFSSSDIGVDDFLVVMNGANKDPQRKGYPRMLTAIQIFLANNPDAHDFKYYIHSWAILARDLPHLARVLNVEKYGRICSDYHNLCGVPEKDLARIYGAGDVFMHLSEGGGFEIPILESLSCGVPVIGSDFICMSELVKDHGWLIPPIRGEKRFLSGVKKEVQSNSRYFSSLDALQQIDDEYEAADALEDAYNHPEKLRSLGEEGRKFALNFDWSLVMPMWYRLFEEIRDERKTPPLEARRLA